MTAAEIQTEIDELTVAIRASYAAGGVYSYTRGGISSASTPVQELIKIRDKLRSDLREATEAEDGSGSFVKVEVL